MHKHTENVIDEGRFGTVYLSRNNCVTKCSKWSQCALTEITLLWELSKNTVCRGFPKVIDFDLVGNHLHIEMERYKYISLRDINECFSIAHKNVVAIDLVNALAYLHSRHYAHLDIKEKNILFTTDQRPILIDYGVAHYCFSDVKLDLQTECSPPETFLKGAIKDHRKIDVWQLARYILRMFKDELYVFEIPDSYYEGFSQGWIQGMFESLINHMKDNINEWVKHDKVKPALLSMIKYDPEERYLPITFKDDPIYDIRLIDEIYKVDYIDFRRARPHLDLYMKSSVSKSKKADLIRRLLMISDDEEVKEYAYRWLNRC